MLVYDFTTFESTLNSLQCLLKIDERSIIKYCARNRDNYNVDDFLKDVEFSKQTLIDIELSLVSLHVTTAYNRSELNNRPILNLQEVIKNHTPFKGYLESKNIEIVVDAKKLIFEGKTIDLNKEYKGITSEIDWIVYKLYHDYQINSFFHSVNVLKYGGNVSRRPEFLHNLSRFLGDTSIEYDWVNQVECFVIKYQTQLLDFADFTFSNDASDWEFLDAYEIKLRKIEWVINQSLRIINNELFHGSIGDCFAYMKPTVVVSSSDILKIYNVEEYLNEYKIKEY